MAYAHSAAVIATPIGAIRIESVGELVAGIHVGVSDQPRRPENAVLAEACGQLSAYFARELAEFNLPLVPSKTERGPALRHAILAIGFGQTLGYGEIAARIGSSARAVGQACARNPFPIVVPCHRVLAAGGRLGPYSAGDGPVTKQWLLRHEQAEDWLL